jgi:negative regulator of flagellin synthesis FlgM
VKIDDNSSIVNLKACVIKKQEIEQLKDKNILLNGPSEPNFENIELSARSKEFAKIKNIVEKAPEIREEKVNEIRKKIEEGNYQVDSLEVARKMLREHLIDLIV